MRGLESGSAEFKWKNFLFFHFFPNWIWKIFGCGVIFFFHGSRSISRNYRRNSPVYNRTGMIPPRTLRPPAFLPLTIRPCAILRYVPTRYPLSVRLVSSLKRHTAMESVLVDSLKLSIELPCFLPRNPPEKLHHRAFALT